VRRQRGDAELPREIESPEQDDTPVLVDRPMLETAAAVFDDPFDLKPGTQLGPYRIADLIGAGGMGQVYRATDTRLNRTVAIKVLPQVFATDPQFRSRFDREAHVIASLNHPHICTLHDVGRYEGVDFLVMEYLDGDTLAARLRRGPLPFNQAMTFAIEIADALTAAHRVGIVHRDLKPGNIILTRTGAKLLDFGLAKPASGIAGEASSLQPTTESSHVTAGCHRRHVAAYAPEQLIRNDAYRHLPWRHRLRNADRQKALKEKPGGSDCGHHAGRAACHHHRAAAHTAGPRSHRQDLPGERSRRSMAERARSIARTAVGAARSGRRGRVEAGAGLDEVGGCGSARSRPRVDRGSRPYQGWIAGACNPIQGRCASRNVASRSQSTAFHRP
jgi:serine/threonine protein kinase